MTDTDLADRVEALERELAARRTSGWFARLYGPIAVVATVLPFLPLLEDVTVQTSTGTTVYRFGSLWQMAGQGSVPNPAVLRLLVVLSLVVLLVVATVRPVPSGVPKAIAVHALLLLVMIALRPGTGGVWPGLTTTGVADVVVLLLCLGVAVAHVVRLSPKPARE